MYGLANRKTIFTKRLWDAIQLYVTISEDSATLVAQGIHDMSMKEVKEIYKAQGVEILNPNEHFEPMPNEKLTMPWIWR